MNANTLRDFFELRIPASILDADLRDAFVQSSSDSFQFRMKDLTEDFTVTAVHLIALCDAVLAGELAPEALRAVGFGVIASEHFSWVPDHRLNELVGETLHDWASPEANYPLTPETIAKFRHRLITGEHTFTPHDHSRGPTRRLDEWSAEDGGALPA